MNKGQAMMIEGPVPGQSLTDEPKAFAWEQPPHLNDEESVFDYYVEKMSDEEVTDNLLGMMDLGMPISIVADSMLSKGVMDGIHTIDMKLLMKDKLGKVMKDMAEEAGINYKLTLDDYRDRDSEAKTKRMNMLATKLKIRNKTKMDAGDVIQQQVVEDISEEPMEAEEAAPQGLMAKE